MKRNLVALVGAISILVSVYATPSMAISLGFGASGGYTNVDVEGTEILNGQTVATAGQENLESPMGSVYVQLTVGEAQFGEGNGFVIGYDMGIGEASTQLSRNIINKRAPEITNDENIVAQATVSNLDTIYIETPGFTSAGLYLRAGWSDADVTTGEDLLAGSGVGDGSFDGATYGFGFKKSAGKTGSKLFWL